MNCPACGHPDGACSGDAPFNERQIITAGGLQARTGPERVPVQRKGIGKAGYVGEKTGKVELYDPDHPNIKLVSGAEDPIDASSLVEPVEVKAPRTRRPRAKKVESD